MTFSPTMTLELYAQPFFASAHYSQFKEFDAPRRAQVSVYGQRPRHDRRDHRRQWPRDERTRSTPTAPVPRPRSRCDNPDFNFRSLRGSAVFRWEYRPGSTLYFVWTQQRSDQAAIGDFDFAATVRRCSTPARTTSSW